MPAFNWTSRPRETPYSRPSVVGDGGAGASLTGRKSLDLVALSSRSLSTSVNSATTLEQAAPNPRPLPAVGYEPSFSPRPLPALSCEPSFSGLRSLQPQGPPLLSPAHEQLSGTIEQRRYVPRLSGLPQPRRQLPLLSDSGESALRGASPFGGTSFGWEATLDDGPHDARSAGEGEGSLALAVWERAAPAPVVTHLLSQPRLAERQSLRTFGLQQRTGALGGSAWSRHALEAEPMLHMNTGQRVPLSAEPPRINTPTAVASPRVSWLQSPPRDGGLRLSADALADESRASPAPLAVGDGAVHLAPPSCLARPSCEGGASHSPSASRSTSPPPPSGRVASGGQRGRQPPAFRTRSSPSLQPLQPLCSEPSAHLPIDLAARGVRMPAGCAASARVEPPATGDAAGDAAGLLSSPGAEHATGETEAFEEYGSFMPAATSPRLASPSADKREEAPAVPLAPLPTSHDKRTQTTPRLSLTTSCGTQTSPQPAARSP